MSENKIFKGDVGTKIVIDIGEDVTNLTSQIIYVQKPDGSIAEWSAQTESPTSIYYIIKTNDLNLSGTYILQPYVTTNDWSGHGTKIDMYVSDILS